MNVEWTGYSSAFAEKVIDVLRRCQVFYFLIVCGARGRTVKDESKVFLLS